METDINIVQHKILETLRRVALTVSKEHDKLQIETATLHFTTLVAYLNDFEKYSKYEASNSTFLHQKKIPSIDITIKDYDFPTVSTAIENLAYYKDVKDNIKGQWLDIEEREIELTQIGLLHYNTQFYLRQSIKEKNEIALLESSLKTNRNVRLTNRFIWASIVASIISAWTSYLSYNIAKVTNQREQRKDTLSNMLLGTQQLLKQKERVHTLQQKIIDSLQNILNDKTK